MRSLYRVHVEITPLNWNLWPVRYTTKYTTQTANATVYSILFLCFELSVTLEAKRG